MDNLPYQRRGTTTIVVSVILFLLSLNAIIQVTGVGTWRLARWAATVAVLYGLVTGIMIVSLGWFIRRSQRRAAASAAPAGPSSSH